MCCAEASSAYRIDHVCDMTRPRNASAQDN
jgi:hypothetical protein